MSTNDRSIRISAESKSRDVVLSQVRRAAPEAFRTLETWGVVDSAAQAASDLAERLEQSESIWLLFEEKWISPQLVGIIIQILGEAWEVSLFDAARDSGRVLQQPPYSEAKLTSADLRKIQGAIRAAAKYAKAPPADLEFLRSRSLSEQLDGLADRYELVRIQLDADEPPPTPASRPRTAETVLSEELERILGGWLKVTQRRKWSARIISEFLGTETTADQLRRREGARASAQRRAAKKA